MLYDIKILMEELDMSEEEKEKLVQEVRNEFPDDDMLFELHFFRLVKYLNSRKL
jgi:hypothetical protein